MSQSPVIFLGRLVRHEAKPDKGLRPAGEYFKMHLKTQMYFN